MTFDEAMTNFAFAVSAIDREHPELREITRGARSSAKRISERFRIDGDTRRADRELAVLLLDIAEAAERQEGVSRDFTPESQGGPPSLETLEAVRAQKRLVMGIAGVGAQETLLGAELGAVASAGLEQVVRSAAVRSGNTVIDKVTNWIMDVFGGPGLDFDLRPPVGTVTIYPFGRGDPAKAAAVLTTAALLAVLTAYALLRACSCPPCHRGVA